MRVPKKYKALVVEALELAASKWQRCCDDQGGCQPDNASYERSIEAGLKAQAARSLVRELDK